MKKAYIAGPITGLTHTKIIRNFSEGTAFAERHGYFVISPIIMDYVFDGEINEKPTSSERRKFARRDMHILINEMAAENGDVIILLPGWENSNGATAERALGVWIGLGIMELSRGVEGLRMKAGAQ